MKHIQKLLYLIVLEKVFDFRSRLSCEGDQLQTATNSYFSTSVSSTTTNESMKARKLKIENNN